MTVSTAAGYRTEPDLVYAAEAQSLWVWCSAVWAYVFAELARVEGDTRPQPSVAEIMV